jgi:hypothetical protein
LRNIRITARPVARVFAVCALLGGTGAAVLLAAGPASAADCATTGAASCTADGSAGISAGFLTLVAPASLTWADTLSGVNQTAVDTTDTSFVVNDATASGAGWNVTAAATQFTDGPDTLADATTFSINGSVASATVGAEPTANCSAGSTCTEPDNTALAAAYPIAIPTGAALAGIPIYDAALASGLGSITIGAPGANAVGWWIAIPSDTVPGTYLSTVTLDIVSGP